MAKYPNNGESNGKENGNEMETRECIGVIYNENLQCAPVIRTSSKELTDFSRMMPTHRLRKQKLTTEQRNRPQLVNNHANNWAPLNSFSRLMLFLLQGCYTIRLGLYYQGSQCSLRQSFIKLYWSVRTLRQKELFTS